MSEEKQERRRDYESWHLDKRINVGHLMTTVAMATAIFIWAMNTDSRITRLEAQQESSLRTSQEIKTELQIMNRKIDRLIETMLQNGYGRSRGL